MEFESYSIYRDRNNTKVRLKDIDELICRELNLEHSEKDFGHFYFTEPEEQIIGSQTSISWAGLLHVITYYSKLQYGRCTTYDVESAMAWVRHYAVLFPPSVMPFTTKLMDLLTQNGLYVHCDFARDNGRKNEFICGYYGESMYLNESGVFQCGIGFNLRHYYPTVHNLLNISPLRQEYGTQEYRTYYSFAIDTLVIPSGIRSIHSDFFNGGYVERSVMLPDSLQRLEGFNSSFIREITIPAGVKTLGWTAFRECIIQHLRLERIGDCEFQQGAFGGSRIEYLSIPEREMLRVRDFPFIDRVQNIKFH